MLKAILPLRTINTSYFKVTFKETYISECNNNDFYDKLKEILHSALSPYLILTVTLNRTIRY